MIYYSDKHEHLVKGKQYTIDNVKRTYLGFTHIDAGSAIQYRFKGEGVNSYANKTAIELDKSTVDEVQP